MSERTTDLDDLQRRVAEWGNRTFMASTPRSKFFHLFDEVNRELRAELFEPTGAPRNHLSLIPEGVAEECADICMMLLHICAEQGMSLAAAVEAKFAVVQGRTWGEPDAAGVVEHVRDGEGR